MLRMIPTLAVLILLGAAGDDAVRKELDRLQGEWTMVGLEVNGQEVAAARIEGTVLTIKGDLYLVKVKNKEQAPCRITLSPSKDPRELDMRFEEGGNKDKVGKAIYRLDGDTLKVVRGLNPEQERPREFGTWPDTNVFMVTWKKTITSPGR